MSTDLETNLQIIEEFTQRLQVAVIGAEETTNKHVDWVEGPVDGIIDTANGPMKTLRGQIAEWRLVADQDVASAINDYDTQFAAALTQFQNEFDAYLITVGFEPAVEYAAGILIERRAQTVAYNGVTYYWTAVLPYTTTGDFGTELSWQIAPIIGGIETPSFTFTSGGKLLRKTQSVLGLDGEWYYWTGTFPKTIAAASTLESAGGVGENLFKISSGFPPLRPTLKLLSTSIGMELNVGSFEGGATLTAQDEVLAQFLTGKLYKWNGVFPKVVDLHSTPSSSGGISPTGWSEIEKSSNWTVSLEALRRSYAEAGYNVVGTFRAGFTYVNANDVGIDDTTGNGFTGPVGFVAAGTDPASGGFVDVSSAVYGATNLADISAGVYGFGARLRVKDLGNSLWVIVVGGVVDGVTVRDAGAGKTAVLQYEHGMDLEAFGVSETATPAQNFAGLAAAIKSNTPFTSKNKTYVIGTGSIDTSVKTINWVASGTEIKLESGNKPSALFVLRNGWSYYLSGMTWNGNRLNVSGNNAGFFAVSRTANFIAENTKFKDLRRYGYNIIGDNPYNTNVKIINLQCDDIGVLSAANGGPVGEAGALGEAVKCEHVRNFTLDGFEVKNSSGTGDGQVQKAFYCVNVTLKNFNLDSVGPSKIYPAISNVRNRNVSYENINIVGASQVCIEDNSNLSVTYKNILTFGRKAMISGSDGAELGARHSQNVTIENWDDTSTEPLAFNIVAVQGLTVRGLATNQNINISRDDPSTDRRSRDITLSDVTCTNLSTLLTQGYLELNDCDILGVWTNTHVGTAVDNNSSVASYTDSSQADTALVRVTPSTNAINIFAAIDAGASITFKMPKGVGNNPFAGKVNAVNAFTDSPATQWSQIDWAFYDYGTPSVNKTVVMSGSTPRQNTALSVSATNKTLTFTNNDSVRVLLVARVELIDRSAYKG